MGDRHHIHPDEEGIMYLVAIVDLYIRYVINWSVSNSTDATWCKEMLEEAIEQHGKPEIINIVQLWRTPSIVLNLKMNQSCPKN